MQDTIINLINKSEVDIDRHKFNFEIMREFAFSENTINNFLSALERSGYIIVRENIIRRLKKI